MGEGCTVTAAVSACLLPASHLPPTCPLLASYLPPTCLLPAPYLPPALAGVPVIEQFEGTWAGAAAGILRHHDSTRIHFSDTGGRLMRLVLTAPPFPANPA